MNEAIREMFLTDWVRECATENDIVEKLIENDEMAKKITLLQNRIIELEEINKQHQEINGILREKIDKAKKQIEKQKQKMYKSRNKIAMFILMKIENILQDKEEV